MSHYRSTDEGREELRKQYDYWTEQLGKRAMELAYAVIAGVWAIAQTNEMGRPAAFTWGVLAIVFAMLFIAANLALHYKMVSLHSVRINNALGDPEAWEKEFHGRDTTHKEWPFSREIERLGDCLNRVRLSTPLAAGAFFLAFAGFIVWARPPVDGSCSTLVVKDMAVLGEANAPPNPDGTASPRRDPVPESSPADGAVKQMDRKRGGPP